MKLSPNIFIYIPGFNHSDLEFINNSKVHEEVSLLASVCGLFVEKIHIYNPRLSPIHTMGTFETMLINPQVSEVAKFLYEIGAYSTIYIDSIRGVQKGKHLIRARIRSCGYNDTFAVFKADNLERETILGVIQEIYLHVLGRIIDNKNNEKTQRDNQ